MKRISYPCAVCCVVLLAAACSAQKSGSKIESHSDGRVQSAESRHRLEASQDRVKVQIDYLTPVSGIKQPEIFVYKEKRRLYVIQANVLVRDYPVALGSQPWGDKEKRGDGKTPEGDFRICSKDPVGRFTKALGLNYPDKKHAERAYFSGLLNGPQLKEILSAHEKRTKPPIDNPIGGIIAIHGGGAHKDWTDGCIGLYDSDLEELFRVATIGTPVSVRP
jgi:murein L,D-transpeptidase YafK